MKIFRLTSCLTLAVIRRF